jgi:hypothetical protein
VPSGEGDIGAAVRCAKWAGASVALARSDAVFTGRVLSAHIVANPASPDPRDAVSQARFLVGESWKGLAPGNTSVVVNSDVSAEGNHWVIDGEYLVFAVKNPAPRPAGLYSSVCTGTRLVLDAKEDLAELGAGIPRARSRR